MDSQPRYSEPKPRELQLPLRCDPVPLPRSPSKTFAASHRANPNPTLFRPASRVGCQDIAFLYIMQLGLSRGWAKFLFGGPPGRSGGRTRSAGRTGLSPLDHDPSTPDEADSEMSDCLMSGSRARGSPPAAATRTSGGRLGMP